MKSNQTLLLVSLLTVLGFTLAVQEYRTYEGHNNNPNDPLMGAHLRYFSRRNFPAYFADGVGELVNRGPLTNARFLSIYLGDNSNPPKNPQNITMFEAFFGQFINHDIERNKRSQSFDEDYRTPLPTTTDGFPFNDTLYVEGGSKNFIITRESIKEIDNATGVTEVRNHQTSWFDLSQVYGPTEEAADNLRTFIDGKLLTQDYTHQPFGPFGPTVEYFNFPPYHSVIPVAEQLDAPVDKYFGAGDPRINENVGLMSVHVAFLREHNRIADELKVANPTWDDETLYQEARRRNIAVYQHIIINEYLPAITQTEKGEFKYEIGDYDYDSMIDADTSYIFATVAFRYGHSVVNNWDLVNDGPNGECLHFYQDRSGQLSSKLSFAGQMGGPVLNQLFTMALATTYVPQTNSFLQDGLANIVRGLLRSKSDDVDIYFSDSLRNIVTPGLTGAAVDLFTADVMRARINGLPHYHDIRKVYGINVPGFKANIYDHGSCSATETSPGPDPIQCFFRITKDHDLAEKLQTVYGKINNIDPIVGMLAEHKKEGKFLPPTMERIIVEEYLRKRNGDRLWYESEDAGFTPSEIEEIESRSLADILRDNIANVNVQDEVFVLATEEDNVTPCSL